MKSARQTIKLGVSAMLNGNKGRIISLDEMANKFMMEGSFWDSYGTRDYFAVGYGIKGTITQMIHELRAEGRYIFSPENEDGYVELDLNDPRSPEFWDKVFDANHDIREEIPKSEKKLLARLIREFVQTCPNREIKEACIAVALRHGIQL